MEKKLFYTKTITVNKQGTLTHDFHPQTKQIMTIVISIFCERCSILPTFQVIRRGQRNDNIRRCCLHPDIFNFQQKMVMSDMKRKINFLCFLRISALCMKTFLSISFEWLSIGNFTGRPLFARATTREFAQNQSSKRLAIKHGVSGSKELKFLFPSKKQC